MKVSLSYSSLRRSKAQKYTGGVFPASTCRAVFFSDRTRLWDLEQALRTVGLVVAPATTLPPRATLIIDPPSLRELPMTLDV